MAPSIPGLPLHPGVVTLSPEELAAGKWNRANRQRIAEFMHRDGLLVMSGIITKEPLLALREAMTTTSQAIKASKTNVSDFNHGVMTNFLQSPPMSTKELLFPEVYQNTFVHQAVETYLGNGVAMAFLTANTALANTTDRQPVHKDASFVSPAAPYTAVVNFLLSDFKPSNGSTEFWLGSHANTSPVEQAWKSSDAAVPTCNVLQELLDERRKTRPPVQVEVPFGSVLLRDPRTWHAGMPNPSDEDRIMIAIGYSAPWFPRDQRFLAPMTSKPLLTSTSIETLATFIPDEEWELVSQKWGVGEPMQLKYLPDDEKRRAEGEDKGWVTINDLKDGEKVVVSGIKAVSG
ncbi:hypothetical protein T439DRAFT_329969 [Meredithblackwellia eburnea MCA 4105]